MRGSRVAGRYGPASWVGRRDICCRCGCPLRLSPAYSAAAAAAAAGIRIDKFLLSCSNECSGKRQDFLGQIPARYFYITLTL